MAEFAIEVNLPNVPEGAEVTIPGLGGYKNGHTYDIDDELVELYRLENIAVDPDHQNYGKDPMDLLNLPEGVRISFTGSRKQNGGEGDQ